MVTFLRRLRARIKYWNNAEELKKELDAHRELAAARFAASGNSERESRWKAARLLGNTTLAREDARAVWIARWIEQSTQDIRYALRIMRREWAFTITASVTLTLGIGVLLGVFTVFNAMFLRPWPVRDPQAVFGIDTALADPAADEGKHLPARISYVVWDQIRQGMTTADLAVKFDHLATLRTGVSGRGRSGRFGLVDRDFLRTVGIELQSGTLPPDGGMPAVAITDAVWRNAFGKDRSIAGRQAFLNDHPVVISGVLEPRFNGFPSRVYDGLVVLNAQTSAWLTEGLSKAPDILVNPRACCIEVIGRLRAGATLSTAADEITALANLSQARFGLPILKATAWHTPMADRPGGVKGTIRTLFGLLFLGCAIVTILACANIGNLQLARGLRRSREIAVRLSLGANRNRIVRQLLTESAAVTAAGTVGGFLLAWAVPPLVMSFQGSVSTDYSPNGTVAAFAVAVAALATLAAGLAPALRVTRIDWRGAGAGVLSIGRLRGVLLATEIALSFALVASASLLSRGALRAADGTDVGFEVRNIYSYMIAVPSNRIDATASARNDLRTALAADATLALGDTVPWQMSQPYFNVSIPGRAEKVLAQNAGFNQNAISLLKLPLIAGRWPHDDWRLNEATISRSLALAIWQSDDVIGRTMATNHPFLGVAQYTVVGIMDEVRLRDATPVPAVITALRADYMPVILGPPAMESEIRTLVARAEPDLRVIARPLVAELRRQMEGTFIGISIASGLGLVALFLASLGVFGVFAYIVEERRREIGVRLALGANRSQVRRSIIAATRWPVALGLAAGLVLAMIGGLALRGNLYGLSILDPLSYLAVASILAAAAMIATYIPMRRATRVDPAVTLRAD